MKKVYFVIEESKETYKGGISAIINSYLKHQDVFNEKGFLCEKVNYFSYKVGKSRLLNKIKNFLRLFNEKKIVYKRLLKDKTNCIVHLHCGYGFVFLKNLLICKYLKKKGIKNIFLSIHSADLDLIFSKSSFISKIEKKYLNKYVDKLILLSKILINKFENFVTEKNKIKLLYTFHNYGRAHLETDYMNKYGNDIHNLLFMGSIERQKGVLDLLSVLTHIDNKKNNIIFCGSKNDKDTYEIFLEKIKDISNVKFCGYVSGDDKEDIFKHSNILVLPSYTEGLPVVIMEAMHFGCVIVSSNVGAIPEIIVNEENGYLFNPGDINRLIEIIESITSDKMKYIGQNNQQLSNSFTCETNIKKLCEIYMAE